MNFPRLLPLLLALLFPVAVFAQTPEEVARKVRVTLSVTDVPPDAAARFVEVLSKVKVHFQPVFGEAAGLTVSVSFENSTADDALKYIASLAKMDLTYKEDGAYFTPKK